VNEEQYLAVTASLLGQLPAPQLLLPFNPTRKRRPMTLVHLHWTAEPGSSCESIYPPLFNRKEVR
jgi:hypothetical protein